MNWCQWFIIISTRNLYMLFLIYLIHVFRFWDLFMFWCTISELPLMSYWNNLEAFQFSCSAIWVQSTAFLWPYCNFHPSFSCVSICSPLIRLPPMFPGLLISRLLMNTRVQRHWKKKGGKMAQSWEMQGGVLDQLSVCQKTCPPVCLSACLLLWSESLNELPAWTTTQRPLFGLPFHVPLNARWKETETAKEGERD